MMPGEDTKGIAVIGMAVRLPGASTPEQFWQNLRDGVDTITCFSDAELLAAGVDPALLRNPAYVKASPILAHVDSFDAAFFGYSPREATVMDPQHRLFLETCWEAVENAGYDPDSVGRSSVVGVFAGAGSAMTSYLFAHRAHPEMQGDTAGLAHINNDKDFLSTRVSYKLNLSGPSLNVQTACSTSLVAVHLACQSLRANECDMALAGASTVRVPHIRGYLAERGTVQSTDGHCRPFDATGAGTVFGSGVAAVLLKPVASAIADRDHIYAVIKGSAVNNDGAQKISYTAASAEGQARAAVEALEVAQVSAEAVTYVECHATGTVAGDPVEIQGLSRAFRLFTDRRGYCAVGSVKANIGHPEQTAGLAGLIKTALSLERATIPPNIHLNSPNPNIPFSSSPFYAPTELSEWPEGQTPRRACVNSLGIGGTNAFIVMEEAPEASRSAVGDDRRPYVFCSSAKTRSALHVRVKQLVEYLESHDEVPLGDICHTSNVSRSAYQHRISTVCTTREELSATLGKFLSGQLQSCYREATQARPIAFLFSGQGAQYPGMCAELYRSEPLVHDILDECDALLRPYLGTPLLPIVFGTESGAARLNETRYTQPALFAVEYALARLWQSWGIVPSAVMGHSVGEIAAACVAGVLELGDAIEFVAARGNLMQEMPERGGMTVFFADPESVQRAVVAVGGKVDIAALNSPRNTVVSGAFEAVERVRRILEAEGIEGRQLAVSHAFHSPLVEPILDRLEQAASRLTTKPPSMSLVANVTGTVMSDVPRPQYWRQQARQAVHFSDGVLALKALGHDLFLEVGPGAASIASAGECLAGQDTVLLASMSSTRGDLRAMLESLSRLYLEGHTISWENVGRGRGSRRVPLPTYPFERKRFWLDAATTASPDVSGEGVDEVGVRTARQRSSSTVDMESRTASAGAGVRVKEELPGCMYYLAWSKRTNASSPRDCGAWLVLADTCGTGAALAAEIERCGGVAHVATRGAEFASLPGRNWTLDVARQADFERLLREVAESEGRLRGIVYLWGLDVSAMECMTLARLADGEGTGVRGALYLVQAMSRAAGYEESRLWFATRGAQSALTETEPADALQAALWGFGRTVALEKPRLWGGIVDLASNGRSLPGEGALLLSTVVGSNGDQQIALRGSDTYVARLVPFRGNGKPPHGISVRGDATYLITGGLGMLGLLTARWLVEEKGARSLVLMGRRRPTEDAESAIAKLAALGARIRTVSADVSNERDVQNVLGQVRQGQPPLKGIIHCAGVLADAVVERMEWEDFTRATAPKIRGGWLLHEHTRDLDLDLFMLHSSLFSLTGSPGQANYTAANAFLDGLVDYRRAQGLPATGVNWGPWAGGMATAAGPRSEGMWRTRGMGLIEPALGMRVLDRILDHAADHAAVALCNWEKYLGRFHERPSFYEDISLADDETVSAQGPIQRISLSERLAAAAPGSERLLLVKVLQEEVTRELGFEEEIDTQRPLHEFGVDSLMSVNLANSLEAHLGIRVPVVTLLKGPSIESLAGELLSAMTPLKPGVSAPVDPLPVQPWTDAGSATREGGWLVFPQPHATARFRLFCFNFAGGGATNFRSWAAGLGPSIELVAIEPPGRGNRIHEAPLRSLEAFVESVTSAMRPYLDKPCAFYGHCLGALTLYETARHLRSAYLVDLVHLFVSGARSPHRVMTQGRFEEGLLTKLVADDRFDPLLPFHQQPDTIFHTVLREFNIWATDEMLERPDLRTVLLPAIRADFEMAAGYQPPPLVRWDVPITCFNGLEDPYVTRDEAVEWNRYTSREFRIHLRGGNHFLVVDDRDFIVSAISNELLTRVEGVRVSQSSNAAHMR